MTNPLCQQLSIRLCDNARDAIEQGFDWTKADPPVKPIKVQQVVVVRKGTVAGNPTVDFVLVDETGQRFVFMITGNLLKAIPC